MHRDEAIRRIKTALKSRSSKTWSVTGDTGTAWGWITIHAPPKRRKEFGYMSEEDRTELARLLGLAGPTDVHEQGIDVSPEKREHYVALAEDRARETDAAPPIKTAEPVETAEVLGFGKRTTAPTARSNAGELAYRIWANDPSYQEDPLPWHCVAAFDYLQECLDYIAYTQDRGSDVVFQSPADCRLIKATDRRVVWKPIPEATGGDPPRTETKVG